MQRSYSSSSSTTTSLVRTQKSEQDELESYLAILAGERAGRTETEKKAEVVDWGRILDSQTEDLQSGMREEEERDSEGSQDEVPTLFLKPKTAAKSLQPKVGIPGSTNSTPGPWEAKKLSGSLFHQTTPFRKELDLAVGQIDTHNPTESLSLTATDTSTKIAEQLHRHSVTQTTPSSNIAGLVTEGTRVAGPPTEHTHNNSRDSRRQSIREQSSSEQLSYPEASKDDGEQDSNSSSLSLDMSTHFRHNILTLDQLESSLRADTTREESTTTDTSGQPAPQLRTLHSSAAAGSPLEEHRTGEVQSRVEEEPAAQQLMKTESDEKFSSKGEGLNDKGGDRSDDISTATAVGYEDDFENETVQSDDVLANESGVEGLSSSLLAPVRATQDSGTESGEEYSSVQEKTQLFTSAHTVSRRNHLEAAETEAGGSVEGVTITETKESKTILNREGTHYKMCRHYYMYMYNIYCTLITTVEGECSRGPTSEAHTTLPTFSEYPHLTSAPLFPHLHPTHTGQTQLYTLWVLYITL